MNKAQANGRWSKHTQKAWSFKIQILTASSFTSYILVLPESRAPCEIDNTNKVSILLNTPDWLFMTFTKDGCLA